MTASFRLIEVAGMARLSLQSEPPFRSPAVPGNPRPVLSDKESNHKWREPLLDQRS
jgi:hypothetical protein